MVKFLFGTVPLWYTSCLLQLIFATAPYPKAIKKEAIGRKELTKVVEKSVGT